MKLILKENKKKEKKEWQRELCAREAWLQKENDNRLGDTIICLCDAFVYVHTRKFVYTTDLNNFII